MGVNRIGLDEVARRVERLIDWAFILGDTELPFEAEYQWCYVPIPPAKLLEELAQVGESFNKLDLRLTVRAELMEGTAEKIRNYVDNRHMGFWRIGEKLNLPEEIVRKIYHGGKNDGRL